MKLTESEIENLLHQAPRPAAPVGLKDKLIGQIQLANTATTTVRGETAFHPQSWWRRWWPALAPVGASLAFAVAILVQQKEITALKATVQELNDSISATTNRIPAKLESTSVTTLSVQNDDAELVRLQQRIATLNAEVRELEGLQSANAQLREQINTAADLSQQELDAMAEAKARAQRIACVNNLKQIGLAVRIYANDNANINPSSFLGMSNELNTPKILFCPGDTNQQPVKTWAEFSVTRSSYEYLTAGVTNAEAEPQRILAYCPLHNTFGLSDGSVHSLSLSGRRFEDCVVERHGKLYLELKTTPANTNRP